MRLAGWISVYAATLAVAQAACATESSSPSDAATEGAGGSASGAGGSSGGSSGPGGSSGGSGSSGSGGSSSGGNGSSSGGSGGSDASSSGSADAHSGGTDSSLEGGTCAFHENDAGTCSDVQQLGSLVALVCLSGEPPQPQGGSVEDGTYLIDTYVAYGACPQAVAASTTWAICGDRWDVAAVNAASVDASAGPPTRINFVAQAQGSTITFTQTCPALPVGLSPRGYTATPGRLMFIYPDSANPSTIYVSSYTRH